MLFLSSKQMVYGKSTKPVRGIFMAVVDKMLCGLIIIVVGPILAVLMTLVMFYLFIMAAISFVQWMWECEKIKEWRKS